jgi:hypothetical protein
VEKQEAINFILQGLEKNCPESEIADELSQQMGVPYEIVRKFVDRVAAQNKAETTTIPSSAQLAEPLAEQGQSEFTEEEFSATPLTPIKEKGDNRILLPVSGRELVTLNSSERMKIWLQSGWKVQ